MPLMKFNKQASLQVSFRLTYMKYTLDYEVICSVSLLISPFSSDNSGIVGALLGICAVVMVGCGMATSMILCPKLAS